MTHPSPETATDAGPAAQDEIETAARLFCKARGSDPDFYYDGRREWQKVGFIDFDLQAALEESGREEARLLVLLKAKEAELAAETRNAGRYADEVLTLRGGMAATEALRDMWRDRAETANRELAEAKARIGEAAKTEAFLRRRRGALVIERDAYQAHVENLIAAIENDGKTSSLHDWNARMKRAVDDARSMATGLAIRSRTGDQTNGR